MFSVLAYLINKKKKSHVAKFCRRNAKLQQANKKSDPEELPIPFHHTGNK